MKKATLVASRKDPDKINNPTNQKRQARIARDKKSEGGTTSVPK